MSAARGFKFLAEHLSVWDIPELTSAQVDSRGHVSIQVRTSSALLQVAAGLGLGDVLLGPVVVNGEYAQTHIEADVDGVSLRLCACWLWIAAIDRRVLA